MLGDNIKNLRIQKGLTQEELSTILGIAQNTLANYERNFRQPSYEILIKLADYFEVSTDFLLDRISQNYYVITKNADKLGITFNDLQNFIDVLQRTGKHAPNV